MPICMVGIAGLTQEVQTMFALAFMLQGMFRAFRPTKQPLLVTYSKVGA